METLISILTIVGPIVASIITAIVTVRTIQGQEQQKEKDRILQDDKNHDDREANKITRDSDAARKLSESAALIVSKYEVQVDKLTKEIDDLKSEIMLLKDSSSMRDEKYETLSREFEITRIQLKNALEVIGRWMEYAMEHHLPIIATPKTREQVVAEMH